LPPPFAHGGEHDVYFHKRARRYFKATRTDRHWGYGIALGSIVHGATPSEYLDRLLLQNSLFDDDIRLERIVPKHNKPIIITSQPAIKGVQAPQEAIDRLMERKEFRKVTDGAYYDQQCGLLVYDLFPRNAFLAADGDVYPIDPVIQRVSQEFAEFLEAHPYTINLRG
jgi:hypothetical protein